MKAHELDTALKKQGLAPLYLVMGEEDCLRDQAVATLKASVLGGSSADADGGAGSGLDLFNYDLLYGDESDGDEILARAGQAPVFAARRCVVVKSAEKLTAKDSEVLLSYVKEPCETTTLVFVAAKLDKRLKFSKELVERAVVVELKSVKRLQREHLTQLAAYLRVSGKGVGLLINFGEALLRRGLRRVVAEPRTHGDRRRREPRSVSQESQP